jgi:hypothetical protein
MHCVNVLLVVLDFQELLAHFLETASCTSSISICSRALLH